MRMNRRMKPRGFSKREIKCSDLPIETQRGFVVLNAMVSLACLELAKFYPNKTDKDIEKELELKACLFASSLSQQEIEKLTKEADNCDAKTIFVSKLSR